MPCFTYLSDAEVSAYRTVPDDKEVNDLLQELREVTSEEWLIEVRKFEPRKRLFRQPKPIDPSYTLYADCHGEWQVMNLVGKDGGSTVFGSSSGTREAVMNFIIGYVAAFEDMKKRKRDQE